MGVIAVRPESVPEGSGNIARVIPGKRAFPRFVRKGPCAVTADGLLRPAVGREKIASLAGVLELCLPTAFAPDNPPGLSSSLLADYAAIVFSWLIVGCGEAALPQGFSASLTGIAGFAGNSVLPLLGTSLLFGIATTLIGYSEGLYRTSGQSELLILAKSVAWASILLTAISCLSEIHGLSPAHLLASALLSLATAASWRSWGVKTHRPRIAQRNVLVVGAGSTLMHVVDYLENHPELGRKIRGIFEEDHSLERGISQFTENLAKMARAEFVDEIILAGPSSRDLARQTIREAKQNHLDVSVVPDLYGCTLQDSRIESLGEVPFVKLHQETLPGIGLLAKRILDVALAGSALLVSLPFLLLIAAAVRLDSRGPAFYNAERVGRKGRRFRCHKFRTMICGAGAIKERLRGSNQREGPTFKIATDPRITRVGHWLRKYSLDELPQLWNVVKGDMSLVGPRPHPLDDFARYELGHLRRLDMTPGITGLWQVTARRSPSFLVNLTLDLEYIEKWSLWMDLQILCKTVAVVFQGTGT